MKVAVEGTEAYRGTGVRRAPNSVGQADIWSVDWYVSHPPLILATHNGEYRDCIDDNVCHAPAYAGCSLSSSIANHEGHNVRKGYTESGQGPHEGTPGESLEFVRLGAPVMQLWPIDDNTCYDHIGGEGRDCRRLPIIQS